MAKSETIQRKIRVDCTSSKCLRSYEILEGISLSWVETDPIVTDTAEVNLKGLFPTLGYDQIFRADNFRAFTQRIGSKGYNLVFKRAFIRAYVEIYRTEGGFVVTGAFPV